MYFISATENEMLYAVWRYTPGVICVLIKWQSNVPFTFKYSIFQIYCLLPARWLTTFHRPMLRYIRFKLTIKEVTTHKKMLSNLGWSPSKCFRNRGVYVAVYPDQQATCATNCEGEPGIPTPYWEPPAYISACLCNVLQGVLLSTSPQNTPAPLFALSREILM